MQCIAMHSNSMQFNAILTAWHVYCLTQCNAVCWPCRREPRRRRRIFRNTPARHGDTTQCNAVRCTAPRCHAMHGAALQFNVLQCNAMLSHMPHHMPHHYLGHPGCCHEIHAMKFTGMPSAGLVPGRVLRAPAPGFSGAGKRRPCFEVRCDATQGEAV